MLCGPQLGHLGVHEVGVTAPSDDRPHAQRLSNRCHLLAFDGEEDAPRDTVGCWCRYSN